MKFSATLKRKRTGDDSIICFELPKSLRVGFWMWVKKYPDFNKVTIERPFKPRTIGEKSQGHHINGHIQQICNETGNDFDSVKMAAKTRAIPRGYPFDTVSGIVIPYSETRIDTIQAGYLIDELHQIAAELQIELVEE